MKITGKTIIITGASDGIGKAVALRLAREDVCLALLARKQDKLDLVAKQCEQLGAKKAVGYSCDIQDSKQLKKVITQIASDFGEIDVLINIAGIWQKLNYLEDIPIEELERVISTNLTGSMIMTGLVLPYLREREEAAIINFASRSGVTAQPGQAAYCASKWGMRGFTEVLKEDLKDSKIRVCGVYPAGIKTELLEKAGNQISTDEYTEPDDIANVIYFILSAPKKLWLHEVRITY